MRNNKSFEICFLQLYIQISIFFSFSHQIYDAVLLSYHTLNSNDFYFFMLSNEPGARHDPGASHYLGVRHDPGALHDTGARHELAAGVSHQIKGHTERFVKKNLLSRKY